MEKPASDFTIILIDSGTTTWKPDNDGPYLHLYEATEGLNIGWNAIAHNLISRFAHSEAYIRDELDVLVHETLRQGHSIKRVYVYRYDWEKTLCDTFEEKLRKWPAYDFNGWSPKYEVVDLSPT